MTEIPRITYLGQSGFYFETADSKLLLDPRDKKSGNLKGDLVYCTHNHFDHTGGVETFLTKNQEAVLIGNEQVTSSYSQFGDRVKTVKEGESFEFKSHSFLFSRLRHGVFKSVYNLAVEIRIGDFAFAHCGDAVSFEGFPSTTVDVLAIPIGGAFAASPTKALELVLNLPEPVPTIIPMHWLMRSPESFCKKLHDAKPDVNCVVPSNGEPLKGYE